MVDELIEELKRAQQHWREPDHPQYIEGALYVTPDQYAVLKRLGDDEPFDYAPPKPITAQSVNVILVYPDRLTKLPSGRLLIYSKSLNAMCTLDPSVLPWWPIL